MRPESAAFHELDTLVRNLSDQLAGYRRRAMAAEARVRELDAAVESTTLALAQAESALSAASVARQRAESEAAAALAEAGASRADAAAMRNELTARTTTAPSPGPVAVTEVAARASAVSDASLLRENAALRSLLGEAREKTAQLMERARFLRQQVGLGADK